MNAERLLQLYERVSEAPDAIAHLRRFVLDLAVRGKLVPQDPNDEPASELLKRIATEKARLVQMGEIKKPKPTKTIDPEEHPFDLPTKWKWVRLSNILTKLTDGTHHSPPNGPEGDFKYITAKNIKNDGVSLSDITYVSKKVHEEIFARCNPEKGDVLYIKDGATTGVVAINDLDEPFSMLSSVALLKLPPCLFNRLITEFLRSPFFYEQMRGFMKGAAITRVTLKRMGPALLPLSPLAEQHRIVAKVDELMALCDQLEETRTKREATRDRLTAASLTRLTATGGAPGEDGEAFKSHARFALDNLAPLTARSDQIKTLRQSILNLAVRGKLVPQEAGDEPALDLLKRITKDIEHYAQDYGVHIAKFGRVSAEDQPFASPSGWAWTRLASLCRVVTDGDHQPPPRSEVGIAFLTIGNVTTGKLSFAECRRVPPQYFHSLPAYRTPARGDLLYTVVGATFGRPILIDADEPFCVQRHIAILKPSEKICVPYLHRVMASPFVYEQAASATTGAAQPTIALKLLRNFLIPLPPFAEQQRIVAKVDELMALCDRLEANLTEADHTRRRLLEALLHEALQPAESALEAAQ